VQKKKCLFWSEFAAGQRQNPSVRTAKKKKVRASRLKRSAQAGWLGQRLDPKFQSDRSSLEPARRILAIETLLFGRLPSFWDHLWLVQRANLLWAAVLHHFRMRTAAAHSTKVTGPLCEAYEGRHRRNKFF